MPTCFFLRMFYWIWIVTLTLKSTPISEVQISWLKWFEVFPKKGFMNPMFCFPVLTPPASSAMSTICKEDKFTVMTSRSRMDSSPNGRSSREVPHLNMSHKKKLAVHTYHEKYIDNFYSWNTSTLQGINISHLGKRKIIFKMPFFGDMLVPWRVYQKSWKISCVVVVDGVHPGGCQKSVTVCLHEAFFTTVHVFWILKHEKREYRDYLETSIKFKSFHVSQTSL